MIVTKIDGKDRKLIGYIQEPKLGGILFLYFKSIFIKS